MQICENIKRLREKLNDNDFWALSTVWGIGYKFDTRKPVDNS